MQTIITQYDVCINIIIFHRYWWWRVHHVSSPASAVSLWIKTGWCPCPAGDLLWSESLLWHTVNLVRCHDGHMARKTCSNYFKGSFLGNPDPPGEWRNKKLKVGRVVATKYFLWMITGKSEEFNTAQCTTSKLHLTNVEHGQEKHRSAPAINVQQCKWSIVLYTMPKYKNSNRRPLSTNACMFHSENKAWSSSAFCSVRPPRFDVVPVWDVASFSRVARNASNSELVAVSFGLSSICQNMSEYAAVM